VTIATTTTPETTTTTTLPTGPVNELKAPFLAELEEMGWLRYVDPAGWSISYPPEWEVVEAEPGLLILAEPDGGFFLVSAAPDAVDDEGSADYLRKNVEVSVADGSLRAPDYEDDLFWVDGNYDDVKDVHDIYGYELSFAVDPFSGEAISAEFVRPVWWYGYYDPEGEPDLGFIFQTIGTSLFQGDTLSLTLLKELEPVFKLSDGLVYSFEPPDGYPGTSP
jgi:hypothetical protein